MVILLGPDGKYLVFVERKEMEMHSTCADQQLEFAVRTCPLQAPGRNE